MDLATLIGILVGFGLIIGSILLNGSITAFADAPSALIVVGGTIATTFIMERMDRVLGAFKVAKNAFVNPGTDVAEMVDVILALSNKARREGILALEDEPVANAFLAKGLRMAVDGLARDEIRDTLTAEMVAMKQRHQRGRKLFKFMGATAPAMGMIGTLIGLVQMLQTLDDPATIGPSMAVALLTTMYGAVLAFVICNPIADKLERRTAEETMNMTLVIEGVDAIVRGHNTGVIREKLEARLAPEKRKPEGSEAA
jgi:chemotaxis protein MotA